MISDNQRKKIIEVIHLAEELKWLEKNPKGYPLMQLSEIEKCMIAMIDSHQLNQMRGWVDPKLVNLDDKINLKATLPDGIRNWLDVESGETLEWKMETIDNQKRIAIVSKKNITEYPKGEDQ